MSKVSLLFSFFTALVIFSAPVLASDTVISNDVQSSVNGGNASSNVSITNNVGGNSTSGSNTTSSNCDVVIDSNGQHKEYHGNCTDLNMQSGNNSVVINHNSNTPAVTPQPVTTPALEPTASPSPSATPSVSATPTSRTRLIPAFCKLSAKLSPPK